VEDNQYYKILSDYWGYSEFRDGQLEVIRSIYSLRDTLAVLPTGAGKSICYQVPGLLMEGVTIVVSPLIALMKDQISSLKKRGIKAVGVMTGQSIREQDVILDNVAYGDVKFLFVSPERLQSKLFQARLLKYNVSMIVIDEAHCISEWGHDFRPEYRKISEVMDMIKRVPYLALTATATERVRGDIVSSLEMNDPKVLLHSPVRHNISYKVYRSENKQIVLRQLIGRIREGCSIIYVNTRKATTQIARYLAQHNLIARAFHGGMSMKERNAVVEDWDKGKVRIMIATKAFGMGIDKSDVRQVIHYNLPESVEAYVQEAGRAGRDGNYSEAIIIINNADIAKVKTRGEDLFPSLEFIKKVYIQLGVYFRIASGDSHEEYRSYNHIDFCEKYGMPKFKTINALRFLHKSELIQLSESITTPSLLSLDEISIKRLLSDTQTSEKMKSFIKLLLRSYEGLFFSQVAVDEAFIAKKFSVDTAKVVEALNWIRKQEMGRYSPSLGGAVIRFNNYRYKNNDIKIEESIYNGTKQRYVDYTNSILSYVNSYICRQAYISKYFDFDPDMECGICDICQSKTDVKVDSKSIRENLIEYISLKICDLDDCLSCFDYKLKNEVVRELSILEEENVVSIKGNIVQLIS